MAKFEAVEALDRAVARGAPGIRKIIVEAQLRLGVLVGPHVSAAIQDGRVNARIPAAVWNKLEKALSEIYGAGSPLEQVALLAVVAGMKEKPLKGLAIDIDDIVDRMDDYLERHGAVLVRDIRKSTREGINAVIRAAVNGGDTVREAAREIVKVRGFGLTKREQSSFLKWIEEAKAEAGKKRSVRRMVNVEYRRRLRRRGTLIARTEAYNAGNEARRQTWMAAEGEIGADYVQQWVARVFRSCPICLALHLKTAEIGGVFVSDAVAGSGRVYRLERPTAHPGCFCATRLRRRSEIKS